MTDCVEVAIPIPGESIFTYSVPEELREGAVVGKRALVPVKNRRAVGFIVARTAPPEGLVLRDILDLVDDAPLFGETKGRFFRWISSYYHTSLGIVLKVAHPAGLGVGIRKTFTLVPGTPPPEGIEKRVCQAVEHAGEISQSRLMHLFEGLRQETLNSLVRRGLIEAHYRLENDPKVKIERIIHPAEGAGAVLGNKRVGSAKKSLLEYVVSKGGTPYADLKGLFGAISPAVSWLKKRGAVTVEERQVVRDPYGGLAPDTTPRPVLNPDQESAFAEISAAIDEGGYKPFLLHGVTGSGKTEVYMRSIELVLSRRRQAIVLVPEISLTPQLVQRFRGRFGRNVAVIHSALSEGDRFDAWRSASAGEVDIVIGARSALFAPLPRLGMIVVDEEHETTYKQEDPPTYNARDLSMVLARMTGSVVILGSATPALETCANALRGKVRRLTLPSRVLDRPMPALEVVDMRRERAEVISAPLEKAMKENLERGGQTILFLNRRGYSSLLREGGEPGPLMCPNCSIPLTYHRADDTVMCHYCGMVERLAEVQAATPGGLRKIGLGTQRVEQVVRRMLPGAEVARMDSDAVRGKRGLLALYRRLERGEIDVLIGTQMVAKGHDLPGVTLVGVVSADQSLGVPDFRAGERTFQLITQVAGRSGRGEEPGRVIVQTYNPYHPSVRLAVEQDTQGFIEGELALREELGYPPYTRLINIKLKGRDEDIVREAARRLRAMALKQRARLTPTGLEVLGPSPAPVYRVRNQFRWQMLIKSADVVLLHRFVRALVADTAGKSGFSGVRIAVDVDPLSFT